MPAPPASRSRGARHTPDGAAESAARLAAAVTRVPRAAFEPPTVAPSSSTATPHPAPPKVIETMLIGLNLNGTERVLCIGSAVGYAVALLSQLAQEVHAVELESSLLQAQMDALAQLGRTNVSMVQAEAVRGKHAAAPFDAIVVTCAAPELPPALIEQLAVGGRIVIPLGDEQGQLIELLEKRVDSLVSRTLGACTLPLCPSLRRTPSAFPWSAHRGS